MDRINTATKLGIPKEILEKIPIGVITSDAIKNCDIGPSKINTDTKLELPKEILDKAKINSFKRA